MPISSHFVRVLVIFGAFAVGGALIASETSASESRSAAHLPAFALAGSIAGGITSIQAGQTLVFVFTETNRSNAGAVEDLHLTHVANENIIGGTTCVPPGGHAINPDGPNYCEPGLVKPGQHASFVIATTVTGASGATATARVCLSNESTGAIGPCKTASVRVG